MKQTAVTEQKLRHLEFLNREQDNRHHTHEEDMLQYRLLAAGDLRAVEEGSRLFASSLPGHVSDDPVRNYKYLFVASITLACRTAIAGGMPSERSYNISDLFILQMDQLQTVPEIQALHAEMLAYYTREMARLKKAAARSRPVMQAMDFIYNHLHQTIRIPEIAAALGLNASYLSTIFHRETGITITEYIRQRRIEAAGNMLRYSSFSYGEIAAYLAFSNQSHFIRVFKAQTGYTPKEYRDQFFEGQQ
jgi:AraC-like DNA-binding protein